TLSIPATTGEAVMTTSGDQLFYNGSQLTWALNGANELIAVTGDDTALTISLDQDGSLSSDVGTYSVVFGSGSFTVPGDTVTNQVADAFGGGNSAAYQFVQAGSALD